MEFHKPKPVHGWREFLSEIGVIVIGVCIALAAEQVVEELRWRHQVQEARQALAAEMAQNIGTAIVAWRSQICTERRLDELAQILDKASEAGVLPPVGEIGRPPPRLWRSGTWDSMVASQVVTHFPREQLAQLGTIYAFVRRAGDQPELETWTDLTAISGPGRRLDPASQANLRLALGRARGIARSKASISASILDQVETLKLPFSPQDQNLITILRHEAENSDAGKPSAAAAKLLLGGFAICRPISPPPVHYGQAVPRTAPLLTDDRLKALPNFGAP